MPDPENVPSRLRLGVDLGGTKIEAIVLEVSPRDSDVPRELARLRVPTDRELGYEHIVEATHDLILEAAKRAGIDPRSVPIGIGMPGSSSRRAADGSTSSTVVVKNANTTCLNGRPFHGDLARAVGRPIAFANDANCFALAEATWGAARGARVTFGVILGTGVGGGLVVPRSAPARGLEAWEGAQGIAGEWGHVPLEPVTGPPCYCGKRGCVETYLSGPAIERSYAERAGVPRALVEIARRADAPTGNPEEDPIARDLIAERLELFGRALAIVINVVDPDVIVLGGGVSNLASLYRDGVRAVASWIFNPTLETRIVKNALGDSAGVLGAALLPG